MAGILYGALAVLILETGLYPQAVLDLTRASSEGWMARIEAAGL